MRSSRLLCTGGESPSPLLHSLGFRQLRRGLLLLQTMVLADDGPRCSCRRCDSDESLARNLKNTRLSSTRPSVSSSEKPKATQMGPTRPITTRIGPTRPITTRIGPTRPETTQGSPPRGLLVSPGESYVSRTTHLARGVVPHSTRVTKGVILLPARGDLETLLTPQESPRE